jgi:hypothetical protein
MWVRSFTEPTIDRNAINGKKEVSKSTPRLNFASSLISCLCLISISESSNTAEFQVSCSAFSKTQSYACAHKFRSWSHTSAEKLRRIRHKVRIQHVFAWRRNPHDSSLRTRSLMNGKWGYSSVCPRKSKPR